MMITKFLDYIFYRSYIHYKKNDDLPMFTSVIVVSSIVGCITGPIWYLLLQIFCYEMPKHVYGVTLVIVLLVYMRYRKKKDEILKRFSNSKYNDIIPLWTYYFLLVASMAFGLSVSFAIGYIFCDENLNGFFWKQIVPMLNFHAK